jgi:hypothetical protein
MIAVLLVVEYGEEGERKPAIYQFLCVTEPALNNADDNGADKAMTKNTSISRPERAMGIERLWTKVASFSPSR